LSKYVPYMVPMVFVVVTLVLIVAFRDVQGVLLSLLPVVTATSITFGFYFWLGLQFSTLTVVVVPVILGLGVDDGIHIVERLRRYKSPTREQLQEAVVGVGRPIFLTTTTTCVSFLALLFTDHSGLESIANFMLVGVPLCFLTSVTMVPAAATLFIVKED
ncbi:MAG: MMPL family transporter, partial [Candidatus Hydrogenedentota bacterium]